LSGGAQPAVGIANALPRNWFGQHDSRREYPGVASPSRPPQW
jgi:hypothetical protein